MSYVRLSPPWWTQFYKIENTIGQDCLVNIREMYKNNGSYFIDITVQDLRKAVALATILIGSYDFGGVILYVRVFDCSGNQVNGQLPMCTNPVMAVLITVQTALQSNKLFATVIDNSSGMPTIGQVVAVFTKGVVQFWNDDNSDYYGNFNEVNANVFADVLIWSYPNNVNLSVTTQNSAVR